MNCLLVEEYFSDHFDDTLDFQTLQMFENHIAECETCQNEYQLFCESVKESQQLPQIEPSPYFLATLKRRLSQEERTTLSFWQRLRGMFNIPKWVFSGVMLLMLASTLTYIYHDDLFNSDVPDSSELTHYQHNNEDNNTTTVQSEDSVVKPTQVDSQFLPRVTGSRSYTTSVTGQPMQQRYVLKKVSYATPITGGGL